MNHQITTIFDNGSIRLESFDCTGRVHHEPDVAVEDVALNHEIVLPRYGVFMRYDPWGRVLADVNHVLFFNRAQPYEISHPVCGQDGCLIITLADVLLMDVLDSFNVVTMGQPHYPFSTGHTLLNAEQQIAKHHLLTLLDRSERHTELEIEETILMLVTGILAVAHDVLFQAEPNQSNHENIAYAMQQFMNHHYTQTLSIDDIATQVNYSPFTACRIFKQQTGLTIHQYLMRLRLFHALEYLIAEPQRAIGDIGVRLGFYSHSHFTTTFSQTFGMSPTEYRDQITQASAKSAFKS
jgi:AraC-like DNA-binding protein